MKYSNNCRANTNISYRNSMKTMDWMKAKPERKNETKKPPKK